MKQRMCNVFTNILKKKRLALVLTHIGYSILVAGYAIYRILLRSKSRITVSEARDILEKFSRKPNMDTVKINREIEKDLSIVVPAYNAEKTIKECVDSVISQVTKYNYELIVINDGSTDNTSHIVEEIEDAHIKLINQDNRGFSGARNRGIDESCGKYIMFLDSDDMLVNNCIDKMMDEAVNNNADIVQGSYFSFGRNFDDKQEVILKSRIIEGNISDMVNNPGFPWAKVYKRKFFDEVRFPLDVWFEDTIVCMLLYRLCKKMVVTDNIVYAYRINPDGITKNARHSSKCIDHYWVMEYTLSQSKKLGLPNDDLQYKLVSGHMSTLLYRRISLMDKKVIESTFVLACELLDDIRPQQYSCKGNFISRDIERAFRTRNFKLWKAASFVV